jgi:phosphoribosylformylglycinamidine synthase subunit PurL
MDDVTKAVGIAFQGDGETVFVIGETKGHVGQSLYLREIFRKEEGAPPPVNLQNERKRGEFVRALIEDRLLTSCHDVSDGGLLVAIAEMAMPKGVGLSIMQKGDAAFWFGEDQGRYVIASKTPDAVAQKAKAAGIPLTRLGETEGRSIRLSDEHIAVESLRHAHESFLPHYMA